MISLDPGRSTGWAQWSQDGTLIDHGILLFEDFLEWLQWQIEQTWVVEDFRLDHRARKQVGSTVEASQVIGAVKLQARRNGGVIHLQRQESRDMGYLHAGLKKAGSHADSHDLDAVAHGYWWLETQRIVPNIAILKS